MMRFFRIFCIVAFPFLLSACAVWTGAERQRSEIHDPELIQLIGNLKDANSGLHSFKGIGQIRLWNPSMDQRLRVAWIGAEPENLRISLLGVAGHPLVTMASNADMLYLVSHSDQSYYKKQSKNGNLKRLFGFQMTVTDIFQLLAGRLPVRRFESVRVETNPATDERVIVFLNGWGGLQEKVHLSNTSGDPYKIERFDREGIQIFSAEYHSIKPVGGYRLPDSLTVTGSNGAGMHLEIERQWVNTPVQPETFVLRPIGK